MGYKLLILFIISWTQPLFAQITWDQFQDEWSSPLFSEEARPIIYTGSAATLVVVAMRDSTFDKIQEDMHEDDPMGDLSTFGDYMGQLIPNLAYMGGMYWHHKKYEDQKSLERSVLMFKTTLYSGLTTGILKRVFNEKRPHGGDRLSFPSGHTTTAFAFASVVGMEHEKHWGIAAYSLATIVGLSRMNDNAHYLHDVLFGATIGISYGVALYHRTQKENNKEDPVVWNIIPFNDGVSGALTYQF